MKFQLFRSIVAAKKKRFDLREQLESFGIAAARTAPYIEPTFKKILFETEKPQVILVSAVGASGKSALAQVLSSSLSLPLLDLGKHKPVGDNTLTGLLTNTFAIDHLSPVFGALAAGEYAIVIDGLDEGRSKTMESAFNAFLDDIVKLCRTATATSFVILGRTQVLEESWLYLDGKGISTGLVAISPFDVEQARNYIDTFTSGAASVHRDQYRAARDLILDRLAHAFTSTGSDEKALGFLSFIGYPPVLDAIVTLLESEKNFHRLSEQVQGVDAAKVETELLRRIAAYILTREQTEKVIPNIVESILKASPTATKKASKSIFDEIEQSQRVVVHCLGRSQPLMIFDEPAANAKYEEQLMPFLIEHPFVSGRSFRNAVFEAVSLANLIASNRTELQSLALEYLDQKRPSHYLLYLLSATVGQREIPSSMLRALLASALEFKAPNAEVEIEITASDVDEGGEQTSVEIEITLLLGGTLEPSHAFTFKSAISRAEVLHLGSRVAFASIEVPCEVVLGMRGEEIELTAPVEVSANKITFSAPSLVARTQPSADRDKIIELEAKAAKSELSTITNLGADFSVAVDDPAGILHPLFQYVRKRTTLPTDPLIREKYLRLRKILTHFRSHSKGALAKYKNKIENPRVAGNPLGSAVLKKLVSDGVLYLDAPMYFLTPAKVDEHLGIGWPDLRRGLMTPKLIAYLASIKQ
jgi:hypothetical protein